MLFQNVAGIIWDRYMIYANLTEQSKRLKINAGFTIVEALMAIIILSICSAVLFSSLHLSFDLVNYIRENITASSIIQEEIEELRKTYFVSLPPLGTSAVSNSSLSSLYNASGVIKIDQYIDANIVRVAVAVTWESRLHIGRQYTKRIVTLIARNGINSI